VRIGRVSLVTLELWLLAAYRRFISPMLGNNCRYYPTCSAYAEQALQRYGFIHGNMKVVWRLLRCAPWGRGGEDPA